MSLLRNDGGVFTLYRTEPVGSQPSAIVATDLNRDGRVDLAVNSPGETTPGVSVLLGSTTPGQFLGYTVVPVGSTPDDLVAGDFDRDGDLDLAVCDREVNGFVRVLRNDGSGVLALLGSFAVGNMPTAMVAADLDRDGDLDLVVANDDSNDISVLFGNGAGGFSAQATPHPRRPATRAPSPSWWGTSTATTPPTSLPPRSAATACTSSGTSAPAPSPRRGRFDAPDVLLHLTAADLNQDGRPDLAAAAGGLSVFRGKGGLDFDPPESVVAGSTPSGLAVGDFNRDGRPDVAVVNDANDVTLLMSTACAAQRLDVSLQPQSCGTGLSPYSREAVVQVLDDGGNLARCATGNVTPGIVPGTGAAGAVLGGPAFRPVVDGEATFTGPNALTIDRAGRRYRLSFSRPATVPATTRSFTLGAELAILGTPSVCPGGSATFGTEGSYDEYAWTLDPPASPFAFTPTVVLQQPAAVPRLAHAAGGGARGRLLRDEGPVDLRGQPGDHDARDPGARHGLRGLHRRHHQAARPGRRPRSSRGSGATGRHPGRGHHQHAGRDRGDLRAQGRELPGAGHVLRGRHHHADLRDGDGSRPSWPSR